MKKLRIYLDTSVFGGVFDNEFSEPSKKLFSQIQSGSFTLCTSEVVIKEIENAPEKIQEFFKKFLSIAEILSINKECIELREQYIKKGIVNKKYLDDALHVATATIFNCDIIVSWNFKHIVHYEKISLYNTINKINGYKEIFINSPAEVIIYED